jgi:hypothetical protein
MIDKIEDQIRIHKDKAMMKSIEGTLSNDTKLIGA